MKYILTESRLDNLIINYIKSLLGNWERKENDLWVSGEYKKNGIITAKLFLVNLKDENNDETSYYFEVDRKIIKSIQNMFSLPDRQPYNYIRNALKNDTGLYVSSIYPSDIEDLNDLYDED
jgi:hypothetical protein